ncbi:MAG TPA: hypothetical protein VFE46_10500 [Pirellulales bacterium]|nr:hypothetical protein [Pirellulales bacterium]
MSGTPNSAALSRAFVSVSFDADAPESFIHELVAACNRHNIPASWAVPDGSIGRQISLLAASSLPHEVAVLADASVTHSDITRTELLNRVARPLQLAAGEGIKISTLAVSDAWQPRHVDLLTKYGVTVIRTPHVFSSRTTTGVRAVCYGLWQVPVSATLQSGGWMSTFSQGRVVKRTVERAMLHGGWCHLRIDVASFAASDVAAGRYAIVRLLGQLQQLQLAGHIAVETLRDTVIRLTPKRSAAAAQSILRAA